MKTTWKTPVALVVALLVLLTATRSDAAQGVKFNLKTPPEPVRATMGTTFTITAAGQDGARINLSDSSRVKNLTVKTISAGANDIREYTPVPVPETGALQVKASFTFGGQYSVVIDGEIDSVKVHDLLFVFVAGPEERGD